MIAPEDQVLGKVATVTGAASGISRAIAEYVLVPTYVQMLGALSAWLGKAEPQGPDGGAETLLAARLAPDMFPLSTQVRFACVQAEEGVSRLRGPAFPAFMAVLLDEGRNAAERPGSIADARARIAETVALGGRHSSGRACGGLSDADRPRVAARYGVRPHRRAVRPRLGAAAVLLPRDDRLRDFARPGVELGKADYVAHMFTYLRPSTPPLR